MTTQVLKFLKGFTKSSVCFSFFIRKQNISNKCRNFLTERNRITFLSLNICNYSSYCAMPLQGVIEDWSLKLQPEDLIKRATELVERSRKVYDSVAAVPDENVSYETVLKVLADDEAVFMSTEYFLEFPQYVSTNSALRDASGEAEKIVRGFIVERSMRQDVFEKLEILERKNLPLKPEAKRYLERMIKIGKRNGLFCSENVRKEVKILKNRINDLVTQFEKNLNAVNTTLEFTEMELNGMPVDFLKNLKQNPDTGKYVLSLKYPDYIPVMQNCRVPETRQKMEFAYNSQCAKENHPILMEMVELRHKAANLLGYPSHASFVTEILMSKSAENVLNFLKQLQQKLAPLWADQKKYMLELKKIECNELGIPYDEILNPYDLPFYSNKVVEVKYHVDEMKLKEYFPMPHVTKQLLDMYQKLLGLKFSEVKDPAVWHKDVKMFSVTDSATSELLGYFFLDLFPRPGKYSHAALIEMQAGCLLPDGTRQLAIGSMVANFSESKTDKPSLMDHGEVTTFFHEFGHVMHYICAQAEFTMFSGTNVERDFVEAPSQMLENWCWEPESLKMLSSHYVDQSEIPDDLLNNLIKSKLVNTGYKNLRQVVLATYDFNIHSSNKCDVKEEFSNLMKEIMGVTPSEGTHFPCNFRHLARDYDSQYYSYSWSEVFSLDMFVSRFKKGNNILNPEVAMDYRRKVLQPGGSKDGFAILQDFLGREPTMDAFLQSKGLKV